jgi:hypothetical protein
VLLVSRTNCYKNSVAEIDGEGSTLAMAGPNMKRTAQSDGKAMKDGSIPISGIMEFDIADAAAGFKDGSLLPVITHEMGHVLGIGTLSFELPCSCSDRQELLDTSNVTALHAEC